MELPKRENVQAIIPCPRHYGIKINAPYSRKTHDHRDSYTNTLTNQQMAGEQLLWLIKKGDLLSADEERVVEHPLMGQFREDSTPIFRVPIFQFSDDEAPSRYYTAQDGIDDVPNSPDAAHADYDRRCDRSASSQSGLLQGSAREA